MIKTYWVIILVTLIAIVELAYGMSDFLDFPKGVALFSAILGPLVGYITYRFKEGKSLSKEVEDKISNMERDISDLSTSSEEMQEVIVEYERIFNGQMWEIECNCGENTFVGLFSPYAENICECDKCKNKYRITLNYESILITEPANNDALYDSLKAKMTQEAIKHKEDTH